MTLLGWIRSRFPGEEQNVGSELRILHRDGSTSALWCRDTHQLIPAKLAAIAAVYDEIDGADLFSSAFKIASIGTVRKDGEVELVSTLDQMATEAAEEGCVFVEPGTVFMQQAGIGYYSIDGRGRIVEFDIETGDVTPYADVFAVFDEWLAAVNGAE